MYTHIEHLHKLITPTQEPIDTYKTLIRQPITTHKHLYTHMIKPINTYTQITTTHNQPITTYTKHV